MIYKSADRSDEWSRETYWISRPGAWKSAFLSKTVLVFTSLSFAPLSSPSPPPTSPFHSSSSTLPASRSHLDDVTHYRFSHFAKSRPIFFYSGNFKILSLWPWWEGAPSPPCPADCPTEVFYADFPLFASLLVAKLLSRQKLMEAVTLRNSEKQITSSTYCFCVCIDGSKRDPRWIQHVQNSPCTQAVGSSWIARDCSSCYLSKIQCFVLMTQAPTHKYLPYSQLTSDSQSLALLHCKHRKTGLLEWSQHATFCWYITLRNIEDSSKPIHWTETICSKINKFRETLFTNKCTMILHFGQH